MIELPGLPSRRAHRSAPPVTQYLQRLFCVFSLVFNLSREGIIAGNPLWAEAEIPPKDAF